MLIRGNSWKRNEGVDRLVFYLPFMLLLVVELYLHSKLSLDYGDDLWFADVAREKDFQFFQWLKERYLTWSSRTFIETVLILIVRLNAWVWRLIDVAMIMVTAIFITKITQKNENDSTCAWVVSALVLFIPYSQMSSAGWAATTINYMWPLACGILSLYSIRKRLSGRKIRCIEGIFYSVSTLFASASEQMVFVLLVSYGSFCGYLLWKEKRKNALKKEGFVFFQFILSILGIIYIAACPGNKLRTISETEVHFPEFADFTFIKKVDMGISAVLKELFFENNAIFIVLLFLVAFEAWKKYDNWICKLISAIPLFVALLIRQGQACLGSIDLVTDLGIFTEDRKNSYSYLCLFIVLIFACCMILVSFYIVGKKEQKWILIGTFVVGLATKAVMGFSPTIWASGNRTGWIMNYAILVCCAFLVSWEGTRESKTEP